MQAFTYFYCIDSAVESLLHLATGWRLTWACCDLQKNHFYGLEDRKAISITLRKIGTKTVRAATRDGNQLRASQY